MFLRAVLASLLLCLLPVETWSQGRSTLGWGRLFTNDALADGQDRWRSGSYIASWVIGPAWTGALPRTPGQILEFRFRGEIIAPANLVTPAAGDRRYVGALSFGAHTHFERHGFEFGTGADLVLTGPQTRIGDFQTRAHNLLDIPPPSVPLVLDPQIPNNLYPTARLEVGRVLTVTPRLAFRPFAEAQAGVETLLRAGLDLHFGRAGQGALMLRDPVTGHRFAVNTGATPGFAGMLGFDAAHVADSHYLPGSGGFALTDVRLRARAGILWQGRRSSVFYGVTWLGREFEAQPEGQLLGSVQIKVRF